MTSTPFQLVIIGAGAAGVFTAINVAELMRSAGKPCQITILEAGQKPLQKVRISGGGRCNVTHACFEPRLLLPHYPRGQKELPSLFSRFQPNDMVAWLKQRGLALTAEPDGRMFPVENTSEAVIGCFLRLVDKLGIKLLTSQRVVSVENRDGKFDIQTQSQTLEADALLISTGYSPVGWQLAASLGHTVNPPVPSLFPFKMSFNCLEGLQGISLPIVVGKLLVASPADKKPQRFEAEGPLLITHTGVSGPLIYRLSALGARALAVSQYKATLSLDLLPEKSEERLRERLEQEVRCEQAKKQLKNTQFETLPHRLWLALLQDAGADLEALPQTLSQKILNRLLERLKRLQIEIIGKSPSKEEFVSCGGVALKEVDFKTMQSKLRPNLYFAGEILDIDGLTGGFNFQACWSAGWVAAQGIVSTIDP